jgi:antitoxin component of MazEF toxin-antitoxin module
MVKTLVKHGNSWALIIDKPVLELLNITPDTPLEISTTNGKSLTIEPAFDRAQRTAEATSWMHETYGDDFRTLAH